MAFRQYFSWLILALIAVLPAGAQSVVRAGIQGPAWTAGMSCPTGQYVTANPDNLHVFRAINNVGGTAGATQPTWNTNSQAITTDGTCQWAEWGTSGSTGNSGGGGSGSTPQTLANCTASGGMVAMLGFQFATQTVGGVTQLCGTLATASSTVVEGICQTACGASGTATVVYNGVTAGILDGAGQANDYVIPSSTPGYFTDVGLSRPSGTTETVGIIALPNSGGNGTAAQIFVSPLSLFAPGSSSGGGTTNNAAQFQLPWYSSPGNTNILSGGAGTTDGNANNTYHSLATNGAGTGVWTPAVGSKPNKPSSGNDSIFPVTSGTYGHASCENANGTSCLTQPELDAFDYGCKEDGSTDDTACANALITAAGSTQSAAVWYGVSAFASNVTFPTNLAIHFSTNGGFQPATSTVTTIKGDLVATPHQQIFFNANSGTTGTIDFTGNSVLTTVYPEWWGAVTSGGSASTNTIAIQNAVYGAFGCGSVITCRTNSNGLFKWNKVLHLQGNYSINGQINFYHVISFKVECVGRDHAGLTQTASNTEIIDGQSVAYGRFENCTWADAAATSQDLNHPLISLDYNASQGADLATQFITFDANNWSGGLFAKIGFQLSRSGGSAQGSNIHFYNNEAGGFTEAAYMIGAGSGGVISTAATNAIEITWIGGDMQFNNAYGIEDFGGGQLSIDGTTFEDGFGAQSNTNAQTGYDMFCTSLPAGEDCVARDIRSESLFMFGGTGPWNVANSFDPDQAYIPIPGSTANVGDIIQGSGPGGHGPYYQVTVASSAYGGLGSIGSPRSASGGSGTTLVDSVGGLTVNAWNGWSVSLLNGTGANAYCIVTSNSATTFTCSAGWKTDFPTVSTSFSPDATTTYIVEPNWGTQTTSGGVTWTTLNRKEFGGASTASCEIHYAFFPGVILNCAGNSRLEGVQVTRADWSQLGTQILDNLTTVTHFDNVLAGPTQSPGSGLAWLGPAPLLRSYNFLRNGITGLSNTEIDQKGTAAIGWAAGQTGGGTSTVDVQIGPNAETGTKNGSLQVQNNSSGTDYIWKFRANGDLQFATSKGQHIETEASASDLAGTFGVASSTTASVSFTTSYTATPVCVLTPQTTGLTSWYLSAISASGFTVTVAPSGTYTFGYVCIGNPN